MDRRDIGMDRRDIARELEMQLLKLLRRAEDELGESNAASDVVDALSDAAATLNAYYTHAGPR